MNSFSCFLSMREASSRCSEELRLKTTTVSRRRKTGNSNSVVGVNKTQEEMEEIHTRPL